jgi:hypothetical protein
MYAPTVKVSTAMTKNKRDVVNKAFEQAAFEVETRKREKERIRRKRYTPMTKAQFRYWVMRDLGLLEEYYDDFE